MLFARKVTGPLSSLLKQFDQSVSQNKGADLRSFAVFLTDDSEAMEAELKQLAEKAKIGDNLPLTIVEDLAGPSAYKIDKDAEVTILLYTKGKVVSNFAFKAGELQEKDVKTITGKINKILPTKEELEEQAKQKKEIEELRKKLEAAKQEKEKKGAEK